MASYAFIQLGENDWVQKQIEEITAYGMDFLVLDTKNKGKLAETIRKMNSGDQIVVKNLTCFDLRTKSLFEYLTKLLEQEKHFVMLDEKIDSREARGKIFYEVLSEIYDMERKVISNSTLSAIKRAQADGIKVGRPPIEEDKIEEMYYLYEIKKMSMRQISRLVGISVGSVSKYLKDSKR